MRCQCSCNSSRDSTTFFLGPNGAVVSTLRHLLGAPVSDGEHARAASIWLYGARHAGKSHLLQALISEQSVGDVLGASPSQWRDIGIPWAEMERCDLLAIDDVEAMLGDAEHALGLMRLLDARHQNRRKTLLTASASPARLDVAFADLRTRLSAMVLLGLKPLQDSDRRELILRQARERGLKLGEDSVNWMLSRLQRDAGSLIGAIEKIDQGSLRAKRRPSLPLIQKILSLDAPAQ